MMEMMMEMMMMRMSARPDEGRGWQAVLPMSTPDPPTLPSPPGIWSYDDDEYVI